MREFECKCGEVLATWNGEDTDCDKCGRLYNAFGQEVTGSLQDIDLAYAGEEW